MSLFILFLLVGLLTYWPALFGGFMGDDFGQIISNIYIHSLKNIPMLLTGGTFYSGGLENKLLSEYYRPAMIIWYTIIYAIFGLQSFYYHLLQLILHIVNTLIIYKILTYFFSHKKLSILLALLFLIHPINVEVVSYLGNIQDLLFFFFGSLGFYIFIRNKPSLFSILITETLFLLALLSKEIAVIFFIVLYSYIDLFRIHKIRSIYLVSSIFTLGCYLYLRCAVATICTLGGSNSVVPIAHLSFIQRFSQMPSMVFFYIKTLFFPKNLAMFQYWIAPHTLYGLYIPLIIDIVFFLILFSLPFILYIYRDRLNSYTTDIWFKKNSETAKVYAFFLLWFLTGLVAHLNILPLDATVAERWFYFAFVGVLGIFAVLISLIENKRIVYILLIIAVCLLGIRSHIRAIDWSDPYRLYSKDITISKNSASLENNFGAVLFERGDIKEAEVHFRKAIKLAPNSPIYWCNLAEVYEKKGNNKKAQEYYLESIKQGRFYVAFEEYARLLIQLGEKKKARAFLEKKGLKHFPYNNTLKKIYEETSAQ